MTAHELARPPVLERHIASAYARDKVAAAFFETILDGLEYGPRDLATPRIANRSVARSRSPSRRRPSWRSTTSPGDLGAPSSGRPTGGSIATRRVTRALGSGPTSDSPRGPFDARPACGRPVFGSYLTTPERTVLRQTDHVREYGWSVVAAWSGGHSLATGSL